MHIFKNHLELIKLVNDNYCHISQLETLGDMFQYIKESPQEQINLLHIICRTTQNSHYDYKLFLSSQYRNPENHVDIVIKNL